jgi:sarcosine oxidase
MPDVCGPVPRMQTCIYTRTPDDHFIIDLHPKDPRIVVASPCSGHGFKFASVIGEMLADLALTQKTDFPRSLFSLNRSSLK